MTKKQVTDAITAAENLEKKLQPIFAGNAPALVAPIIKSLTNHKDRIVHEETEAKKTPEQRQQEQEEQEKQILDQAKERTAARKALKLAIKQGQNIVDGKIADESEVEDLGEADQEAEGLKTKALIITTEAQNSEAVQAPPASTGKAADGEKTDEGQAAGSDEQKLSENSANPPTGTAE